MKPPVRDARLTQRLAHDGHQTMKGAGVPKKITREAAINEIARRYPGFVEIFEKASCVKAERDAGRWAAAQ
jgi:hypothetical protein